MSTNARAEQRRAARAARAKPAIGLVHTTNRARRRHPYIPSVRVHLTDDGRWAGSRMFKQRDKKRALR